MKRKAVAVIMCAAAAWICIDLWLNGNPLVALNNRRLKRAICSLETDYAVLGDVVPFAWDTLYTFDPYLGKAQIEEIVGFSSPTIRENNINTGLVHLLFVHENEVAASILGYAQNLGYDIDLSNAQGMKVTLEEAARFSVKKENGITTLTYERSGRDES